VKRAPNGRDEHYAEGRIGDERIRLAPSRLTRSGSIEGHSEEYQIAKS
jgi:hypothetical protein